MSKQVVYKLTNAKGYTRGLTLWGPNVTHSAVGLAQDLCSPGWIHFYDDPLLALLHNPIHANISSPRLWVACIGAGEVLREGQMKGGCKTLTTRYEMDVPLLTETQITAYGIYAALECHAAPLFVTWANAWLSGSDRSIRSAREAVAMAAEEAGLRANTAARAAARAAGEAATQAARAAAWAARAAREGTWAAEAAGAARAARAAAGAAAGAARAAAGAINLVLCAKKALKIF